MSVEGKIEFLWECAKTLKSEQHVQKLLKSYYINTCRELAKYNLNIPKDKFSISRMCPYCGTVWSDGKYGLKLIPKQIKNRSKSKRLVEKLQANSTNKFLNKKQRNRAKWLKKKISNHLAINCYQCQKRSLLKMENPKSKSREQLSKIKSKSNIETCTIDSGNDLIKYNQKKIINGKSSTFASSKSKKLKLEQKISGCKNNGSNKSMSKTQKQNSLLQLAAFLQKQSKDDLKNGAQNRLQTFLK